VWVVFGGFCGDELFDVECVVEGCDVGGDVCDCVLVVVC